MSEVKDKLARQGIAWAVCRTFVARQIIHDPDTQKEALMETVSLFERHYGFTQDQITVAGEMIDKYYSYRTRAIDLRSRYPNNVDLVNHLFGLSFGSGENFEIKVGPMSIDIKAGSKEFYRLYHRRKTVVLPKFYNSTDGFASVKGGPEPVFSTVLRKETPLLKGSVLRHEHEHNLANLTEEVFVSQGRIAEEVAIRRLHDTETDPGVKQLLYERMLVLRREFALSLAKNETFACLRGPLNFILGPSLFWQDPEYDYLREARVREMQKQKRTPNSEIIKKVWVKEYRQIITRGWQVLGDLKKRGGFSVDESIALLSGYPMVRWSKIARRILEQKAH